MADSPRERRLRNDFAAIQKLQSESTILDFVAIGALPESYTLIFRGLGVWKPEHHPDVMTRDEHQVVVRFNASYPRMMPELVWKTPIFHPNISSSGVVCLGGYGTYWVPSVTLDELCTMLWDMIRYKNFDPESPYNRQAALWAKQHAATRFPIDPRPIRNKIASPNYVPTTKPAPAAVSPTGYRDVTSTLARLFPTRQTQSPFRELNSAASNSAASNTATSHSDSSPFIGPPAPHVSRDSADRYVASPSASGSPLPAGHQSDPMARAAAMLNPVDAEIVIAEVIDHSTGLHGSHNGSHQNGGSHGGLPVASRPASSDILFIE